MIHYRTAAVGDHQIFYREAGDPNQTTLLLLHGFPSSSHMFRNLIPLLSDRFHIVAPDLPGFGFSQSPPQSCEGYRSLYRHHRPETLRALCLRLRRACRLQACRETSRASDSDRLAERQCL